MSSIHPGEHTLPRTIRVFVSSTFKDMQAERDELIKFIFPQLRKICQQRGVVWGQVDLRWGITDEQKSEGKVLPICLEEIQRCRPFFIGILGERYGWTDYEVPAQMVAHEPWLSQYAGHSVTELEILHGVLNDAKMADNAFFYFRDPMYIATIPAIEKPNFIEGDLPEDISKYGSEQAHVRTEQRKQKLVDLKNRIRQSGLPVYDNYSSPKEFGQAVLRDLTAVIDKLFPEGSELDPLDQEKATNEAFAQSRAQVYIGRSDYFDRLDEHCRTKEEPLVVLGESGSGKSALLANWVIRYRSEHPDDFLLMHFIGATPESTNWENMVRRILGELKREINPLIEIPDQQSALSDAFNIGLNKIPGSKKAVIIIDALNQLDNENNSQDLFWLPNQIPSNVRLILSTLPGRSLDEIRQRGWPILTVEALKSEERKQLIRDYLAISTKALDEKYANRLASFPQCSNPLFLRVLLDELQLLGLYETLGSQIDQYLEATSISVLYEKVLQRCERDYEEEHPGLVREAMSYLWAARRGLSENELLELLGSRQMPMPQAFWSPFFLAMEQSFLFRDGLIGFSHDHLRKAVQSIYLKDESQQKQAHLRLADYFEEQYRALPQELEMYFKDRLVFETGDFINQFSLASLRLDELPWQLVKAGMWERLAALLGNLDFFIDAWRTNSFDLMTYWAQVEKHSTYRIIDTYRATIDHPDQAVDFLEALSILLDETGHPMEALKLRDYLVEHYQNEDNAEKLMSSLGNKGVSLRQMGDLAGAMDLYKQQEKLALAQGAESTLAVTFTNQASVHYIQGDMEQALTLYEKAEAICRKIGDQEGISRILGNKALVLYIQGDLQKSLALHKEEERLCREQEDVDGLCASLGNQALIYKDLGDLDGAMTLHQQEEQICKQLGNMDGFQHSIGNQAVILQKRGDLDGAMKLLKEKESICRRLGNKMDLSDALGNQANILFARKDLLGSMTLHKEEESLARELGDKDGIALSLGNQAVILQAQGDLEGARRLYKEEERLYREVGNLRGLQRSTRNQELLQAQSGKEDDLQKVLAKFKEQEKIARESGDKCTLAKNLIDQAALLAFKMNDPHRAFPIANEANRLASTTGQEDLVSQVKKVLASIRDNL